MMNKKTSIIIFLFIALSYCSFSQSRDDVFNSNEIVWYGLDFSKAKMIGTEGFDSPGEVKNKHFGGWNYLILNEPEKYDIKKAFQKTTVVNDISMIEKRNEAVKVTDLVINNDYSFPEEDIKKVVKSYKTTQNKGIGLVFIIESFNKFQEKGTVYVTFFDIGSKKVLLTKKLEGKAFGFGVRNHWAGSINNILKTAEKEFFTWK